MESEALNDVLLARQPIVDEHHKLFSYELLYRDDETNAANFACGDKATSQLLINLCASVKPVCDESVPIFINLTRNLLLSEAFFPLDADRVVIEILEDVKIDQTVIDAVAKYFEMGYKFALDDFTFDEQYQQLYPYISYIKVDVLEHEPEDAIAKIRELNVPHAKLIAEKIETQEIYKRCRTAGFNYFQGYFLYRPTIVRGKKICTSTTAAMSLINDLQKPNVTAEQIADTISKDVKLTYQLLRILNNSTYRLPRKVESLKEAVVFLGLDVIKKWAVVISLSQCPDKPLELFRTLLVRARACELYSQHLNNARSESCFTAGLLSGIDAIVDAELPTAINQLSLSDDLSNAIIAHQGDIGHVLEYVLLLEKAQWRMLENAGAEPHLLRALTHSYQAAVQWADDIMSVLSEK